MYVLLQIVRAIRIKCPETPLVLYINGNGGLLERMKGTGVDVIGLDWTVDMADGRKRLGNGISVQGNVDPATLFSTLPALTEEIQRFVIQNSLIQLSFSRSLYYFLSTNALGSLLAIVTLVLNYHDPYANEVQNIVILERAVVMGT